MAGLGKQPPSAAPRDSNPMNEARRCSWKICISKNAIQTKNQKELQADKDPPQTSVY
eukprot:NODE_11893_length_397_cov_1.637931_g10752_i0.p2 GENE.NODE_11893_length_397_cov_1.637931_g10752_i0~~NODE_11893_length_397_cov_1.637931_g10752_i0.p2  ORF type:complete len:57 (+),score=1.89 NODE_11893_length_397_cov_1.637931_g10752_i0:107-277(+)